MRVEAGQLAIGADLWDVGGPQPVLLESVPVSSGSFAFSPSVLSGQFALAISGTDTATSTGPDFRSGPITAAATATPNVEIVLGPIVTLTADDISRWFAAIPAAPVQSLAAPAVGTIAVDIQSIAAALVPPALRLTGVGTLSGSISVLGSVTSPLSVTVTLGLVPTTNPNPLLPAELTLVAPPHVDLSGPFAEFGPVLNAAIATFAGDWILELMRPIVQKEVSDAAARALARRASTVGDAFDPQALRHADIGDVNPCSARSAQFSRRTSLPRRRSSLLRYGFRGLGP
jgi:hypothetical protein